MISGGSYNLLHTVITVAAANSNDSGNGMRISGPTILPVEQDVVTNLRLFNLLQPLRN